MQAQAISDILEHLFLSIKNQQGNKQQITSLIEKYSYINGKKNFMLIDSLIMFCTSEKYGEVQRLTAFHMLKQARQLYYYPIVIFNNGSNIKDNEILSLIQKLIERYCMKGDMIKHLQIVLSLIIKQLSNQWTFTTPLMEDMETRQAKNLAGIYSILIIFNNWKGQFEEQIQNLYFSLSTFILPLLKKITNEDPTEQLIYVCIKCLWKIIRHQINIHIRRLSNQLMPLLINVLQTYVPLYHMNKTQTDTKGSPQFFYFHSIKWSLKIILQFLKKHAIRHSYRFEDNQFSQQWFYTFGNRIVASLVRLFDIQLPENYRILQLKCIRQLALDRSEALLPFRERLNYQLIPNFIQYPQQDTQMIIQNSYYFYKIQVAMSNNESITQIAIDTWTSIALIGRRQYQQSIIGDILIESLNYIFYLLDSMRIQDQQKAYSLLGNFTVQINEVTRFGSVILEKYFIKSFSLDSIVLKNLVLTYFINKGDLIVDTSIIQPIITNLLCNIETIQFPILQFKCFLFICILGSNKEYLEVLQRNMQLILNMFLYFINICPCPYFFIGFDQLIKRNYKQLPRYSSRISSKLIQCIITITSNQYQQLVQPQKTCNAIVSILKKCSLLLLTYQDHILFAKDLVKLLVHFKNIPRGMNNIIQNYVEKSYQFCIKSGIFYPHLWQDLINYLQNLQQRIAYLQIGQSMEMKAQSQQFGEYFNTLYDRTNREFTKMYLRISLCFVRTMKNEIPIRLLDNIFNFFNIISILSIQRVDRGIQILSCQLYGLILLYNQTYFLQKMQAWIIIAAILKASNSYMLILQYKWINVYILMISHMLKLQNKPERLLPLFQQVFMKLIELIETKMDRIQNDMIYLQESDSQSQSSYDQQQIKAEDHKSLSVFMRTMKYIEQNDNNFYQRLRVVGQLQIKRVECRIARILR